MPQHLLFLKPGILFHNLIPGRKTQFSIESQDAVYAVIEQALRKITLFVNGFFGGNLFRNIDGKTDGCVKRVVQENIILIAEFSFFAQAKEITYFLPVAEY